MRFDVLIENLQWQVSGPKDKIYVDLKGLAMDSRLVRPGDLFVAIRGSRNHGLDYVQKAKEAGAVAVLSDQSRGETAAGLPVWVNPHVGKNLFELTQAFYGPLQEGLTLVGITGTNGKTSTAILVHAILTSLQESVGYVGTLGVKYDDVQRDAFYTTPDILELGRSLSEMKQANVKTVVMEVSSHALSQDRVQGLCFDLALFTNLTQDHLDHHQSFEAYERAKLSLFTHHQGSDGLALINVSDEVGAQWAKAWPGPSRLVTYGLDMGDISARDCQLSPQGGKARLQTPSGETLDLQTPLIGRHNLTNALAAFSVCLNLSHPSEQILQAIRENIQIPGRLQEVETKSLGRVFVDFAHTEDAIDNVLKSLQVLGPNRMLTVLGCGGNRDRKKRPKMAEAALRYSDHCYFTSDNPRYEDPQSILNDMTKGMTDDQRVSVMPDRKRAIEAAIEAAESGDFVLIAGKGHETYQEISGERISFDDASIARQWKRGQA